MVFDGSQKPKLKQTIKLEKLIDSVFYNNKYIGVAYSNNDKKCTSHIKLYDFNGKMLMENDTAIAYNSIEFDSNNEVCVTGDTAVRYTPYTELRNSIIHLTTSCTR